MTTFENLLAGLARGNVLFIVVGGLAVARAGFPRVTDDVDILLHSAEDNLSRALTVLEEFGAGHARELSPSDFPLEEGAVRVIEDFPVDLFTMMGGRKYEDLLPQSSAYAVEGHDVRFLNAHGLITLKSDSHREKDRIDVDALTRLQRENPPD